VHTYYLPTTLTNHIWLIHMDLFKISHHHSSIQDQHFPQEWFAKTMSNCNCANSKQLQYRQLQQRQPHYFPCLICCHQPREPCLGPTEWAFDHIFIMTQQPLACQSLLNIKASQSHLVRRTTWANSCRPMPWTGIGRDHTDCLKIAMVTITQ
jgi:hypothetical protein